MPENFGPERYRRPPEDGPEKYAPPHRRPPDAGVANIATLAKQQSEAPSDTTSATEHLDMMIRRTAMDSMTEIDWVIRELESIRDLLRNEGERVIREVSGLASLDKAAKVIAENLKQLPTETGQIL
jgi:hypothetical protein